MNRFFLTEMMGKIKRPLKVDLKDTFNVSMRITLLMSEPTVNSSC